MPSLVEITHFTDPACPFAFSAEPVRWRLRWQFGDQLAWRTRMIVLTREPGEAEQLADGAPTLQRLYGMPIDPRPRARPASSEPACRAFVAARLHAPHVAELLLRRVRVRTMAGELVDDPGMLDAAAADAGLDPVAVRGWTRTDEVALELEDDARAARTPSPQARALDHKLGGPRARRRYTAPSYELRRAGGEARMSVPGFNPVQIYEAAIAKLAPEATRRPPPRDVEQLLAWAQEPLATAEIASVMQRADDELRVDLARAAVATPAGADCYWTLAG